MSKKIELEYTFNTSPNVLFNRLSTPAGLSEWFADDVNLKNGMFSFVWDDTEQFAEILSKKDNKHIRFRWTDEDKDSYFEFRIQKDELTGALALFITDFADNGEEDDARDLWDSQIAELKHAIGL
ncbi:MAG: SRPBCC domain-containing protein [Bacteroidales bacterium]|nr:SRPBCC domain-containing protein [Bacteroidales bacterium]